MDIKTFGEFFKDLRIATGMTLRGFCLKCGLDPGNISKLERGELGPPQEMAKLKEYAKYLGLKEGTPKWHTFIDLAAAGTGRVPQDILGDKELVARLPVLFRTIRRKKLTKEDLRALVEQLRSV